MRKEKEFYEKTKKWDFGEISIIKECLTAWDMGQILANNVNEETIALDLGTAGCEWVLKHYPKLKILIATDYSEAMIETAKENVCKSARSDIELRVMDNLQMDVPDNYFDVVTARHTPTDPVQIYHSLKLGGLLIVRGVDKLDCWELKRMFGKGQGYEDTKAISFIDYENVLNAGFKDVELVPIHTREYYRSYEGLLSFLRKVPIIDDFSEDETDFLKRVEDINQNILQQYVEEHRTEKGILLTRRYYGITARKR